jgi:hypothetical protein
MLNYQRVRGLVPFGNPLVIMAMAGLDIPELGVDLWLEKSSKL